MVAPLIWTLPPVAVGLVKLKNVYIGLNVKVTVLKLTHAGVYVVAKAIFIGCVSIPSLKMVETGDVEKLKVWTTQLIVTVNVLLIEATVGGG